MTTAIDLLSALCLAGGAFFSLVGGHDLRFVRGAATLPETPGLGSMIDESSARLTPWQPMPKPWLDPRLG